MLASSRIVLLHAAIFSLFTYFFINIYAFRSDSHAFLLLPFFIIASVIFSSIEFYKCKKILINKSFYLLVFFWVWLVVRISHDVNDIEVLLGYTVKTSSGILLFYFMGSCISIYTGFVKRKCVSNEQLSYFFMLFVVSLSIFVFIGLLFIVNDFSSFLRDDVFLLVDHGGMYQRAGIFLSIIFIIYCAFVCIFVFFSIKKNSNSTIILMNVLVFVLFSVNACNGFYLAQMIGSNNSAVCVSGIMFTTVFFYVFLLLLNKSNSEFSLGYNIFNKFLYNGSIASFFSLFWLFIVLFIGINFYDIWFDDLRLFGFGGKNNSLISRYELLTSNLWVHLSSINLFFGDFAIGHRTADEGSYIHSLILSILTNLGIFGLSIFVLYIAFAVKEKFIYLKVNYYRQIFAIYEVMLFLGIMLIACIFTFLSWSVIWFVLGMLFPAVYFKENN